MIDPMKYFEPLRLREGAGGSYEQGLRVVEAVSWLASEGATDTPECTCPALGAFAIGIKDYLDNDNRQQLSRLILPLTGTRSEAHEKQRSDYIIVQVTKRIVSQWFDRAGLHEWADKLRAVNSLGEGRSVALAARNAADAYSYDDANDAADAADSAAYAAKSADAADASAVAAVGDITEVSFRQEMLIQSIDILDEAIKLGPNGYDQWPAYEARAEELVTFAKTVLQKEETQA